MKKFEIPVEFTMRGLMQVEANTLEEALEIIDLAPLPEKVSYLMDSFQTDYEESAMLERSSDFEVSEFKEPYGEYLLQKPHYVPKGD